MSSVALMAVAAQISAVASKSNPFRCNKSRNKGELIRNIGGWRRSRQVGIPEFRSPSGEILNPGPSEQLGTTREQQKKRTALKKTRLSTRGREE